MSQHNNCIEIVWTIGQQLVDMFTYLHLIKLVMAGNLSSACGSEQQEVQHVRGPVPRGGPHGQTQQLWLQPADRRHQPLPGGQ